MRDDSPDGSIDGAFAVATADPEVPGPAGEPRGRRSSGFWSHPFRGRSAWITWPALVLVVALVALAVDLLLVVNRIEQVDVTLPPAATDGSVTYLVVGVDARSQVPAGMSRDAIGDQSQVPGARADAVIVVQTRPDGTSSAVSIPRDLLVDTAHGWSRVALTLLDGGPQTLVDALCRTLGVRTTHLVLVDFVGFTEVVDAAGGVQVTIDRPIRDAWSGLDLPAGTHTLGGVQALGLVRSRHPEELVDGTWTALSAIEGAQRRTYWAGEVFGALRTAAARARTNPVLAQRLAWAGSGALTTDAGTGMFDLGGLADGVGAVTDLPVEPVPGETVPGTQFLQSTDATTAALAAAGITPGCTPGDR